jgi:hypothetical protein
LQRSIDVEALTILRDVLIATVALGLIVFILYKIVVWARTRAQGAYVLGALFSPLMGFGDVVDPDYRIDNETKQGKQKEEDDSGDPLDSPDEDRC